MAGGESQRRRLAAVARDDRRRVAQSDEGALCLGIEGAAGCGGDDAHAAALEDADTEAALERCDSLGRGGLREVENLGGGGYAAGVDRCHEGGELARVERFSKNVAHSARGMLSAASELFSPTGSGTIGSWASTAS